MKSDELQHLENRVRELEEKHDYLERDIGLLKDIFAHINTKFEEIKTELLKRQ